MGQDEGVPSDAAEASFACHRCGTCCTSLGSIWSSQRAPMTSIAGERIHRLPTPGGLRVFAWEAKRFPQDALSPLLAVGDDRRGRLIALAYEVGRAVCPNYDDAGCTIYEDRPLVCRAYPLLVVAGGDGPEATVSGLCPARIEVAKRAGQAREPEAVLARAYPEAFAPALAVPATVKVLADVVAFLETADLVEPVEGLAAGELEAWLARGTVDLVDVVEETGAFSRSALAKLANNTVERIRERWTPPSDG